MYHELKYLCLQYNDMCRQIADSYGISAVSYDSTGAGRSGRISDPTAERGNKVVLLSTDVGYIDKALAMTADEPVRSFIKRAVTGGIAYEHLGDVPMGRQQFYEARRKFFYNLKILKKG